MIREASKADIDSWTGLRLQLWPHCTREECKKDTRRIVESNRETCFLALSKDVSELLGFVEVSTREYVDGCSSSPVGYIEGIYLKESERKKGIGKELIEESYQWMRSKGCTEVGSDALIENKSSIKFHKKIGFREVERHVVFMKQI
jgi:aminoglycoside 6'-N-acetyltransferase I